MYERGNPRMESEDVKAVSVVPLRSECFDWASERLCTNGFTLGRKYRAVRSEGNGVVVLNDNGHERFVLLDGSPSAHIKAASGNAKPREFPYLFERSAGYFRVEA